MKDALLFLVAVAVLTVLWVLPIYACVNLLLMAFHISYHVTIWQTILVSVLILLVKALGSTENKGGK